MATKYDDLMEKAEPCKKAADEAACPWMRGMWEAKAAYLNSIASVMPTVIVGQKK